MKNTLYRFSPLPFICLLLLFHIIIYFGFRLVLFYFIEPSIVDRDSIVEALYIGLKFDARYAAFTSFPLAVALLFPFLERCLYAPKSFTRKIFCTVQSAIFAFLIFMHIIDIGVFFYLQQRLDMTLLEFVDNPFISAVMVWQSYPVIWLSLLILTVLTAYYYFWNRLLKKQQYLPIRKITTWTQSPFFNKNLIRKPRQLFASSNNTSFSAALFMRILSFIVLFILIFGQISSNLFPLRWSNAYLSADKHIALIALHPAQNLFDTRHVLEVVDLDINAAREAFPRMANFLNSENKESPAQGELLDFTRNIAKQERETPLNVVLIMMESLTTSRSSIPHGSASVNNYSGKGSLPTNFDLDATPFLADLIKESLYYPNFYANTRTTARGIFSAITGIPDINFSGGTSSRNPKVVDQQTIFNEFDDYEKYYLIGGNANWANIRGVLQNNIQDLNLLEEEFWKAPNTDVWGISDLALLRESVDLFNESKKPFVAFIQTAGFHRPYTIPADNEGFELAPEPSHEALSYWGFENAAEYQSLRFADHALKQFFDRAKKEDWFANTVFVIFGDHGLTTPSDNMVAEYIDLRLQAWHVPFFIYAPGKIATGVNPALHSQVDMFPTLAAMAGIKHKNTTLGKNILEESENGMFIPKEFSLQKNSKGQFEYMYDALKDKAEDNRVYIGVSEDKVYLLQDKYAYQMTVGDKEKEQAVLYEFIDQKSDPSQMENRVAENIANDLPDIVKSMDQKAWDFYYTTKYLLQNNKKKD